MIDKTKCSRLICLLLIAATVLSLMGCGEKSDINPQVEPLTVSLLKVGKADAIILISDDKAMVIDTGEDDDGDEVADYLLNKGISQIEAMIITHFDQDHVGGADKLIEKLEIKNVYIPDYEGSHEEYTEFMEAAEKAELSIKRLKGKCEISFADARVIIEAPESYELSEKDMGKDYDNNFSLITTVIHGNKRLVFTGDAEKKRIRQWLNSENAVKCDFLKLPHHGIYNGALEELFRVLRPEFAAICSSEKNPAEEKTLKLLQKYCGNIFETKDGNILLCSDGSRIEVMQETKIKGAD